MSQYHFPLYESDANVFIRNIIFCSCGHMLSVNICSVCDIVILSDGLGEFSATEIVQEASLAAIVIIHLSLAGGMRNHDNAIY